MLVFSNRKEDRERERETETEKRYIIKSIFTEDFKHKFCKRVINEETFSVKSHPFISINFAKNKKIFHQYRTCFRNAL